MGRSLAAGYDIAAAVDESTTSRVALNAINKAAPNPLFMLVLFGTAVVCVLLAISGFRHRSDPAAVWQLAGCALYIVSVLVTVGYHIPRNEELMKIDPNSAGAAAIWSHFVTPWMAWNHIRTLTSIGGTVSLIMALRAS